MILARRIASLLALLAGLASAEPPAPPTAVLPEGLRLRDCVSLAVRNNISVRLARASGQEARGRALQAASLLLPQVTGSMSETRTFRLNLAAQGFPTAGPIAPMLGPFNTFDARVRLVQELLDLPAIDRYRAAEAERRIAPMEERLAVEQVSAAAALAYIELFRARRAIGAAQADSELALSLRQLAQDKKTAGTAAGIDVARARTAETEARLRLLEARNTAVDAEVRLKRIIGLPFTRPLSLLDEPSASIPAPPTVESALADASRVRWELGIAAERAAAARLRRRAAAEERLPSVAVSGDLGLSGKLPDRAARTTGSAGMALQVPLFAGRAIEGRVAEAEGRQTAAEASLEDWRRLVEEDVRLSLSDLDSASERLATADEAERLANDELEMARDRFAAGVADNLELLGSQTALTRARIERLTALARLHAARVSVSLALGRAGDITLQ